MKTTGITRFSVLAFLAGYTVAHGGHEGEASNIPSDASYAERHMAQEHHIDTFDPASFFHLHDLNRDGVWDRDEIEAVYGVHHVYSKEKSMNDDEHDEKARKIVGTVLRIMDKDRDGMISKEEYEAAGVKSLPNFEDLGAEGHHYDVESEFFLHHEEQFHNTPETQTEDSYNHPEDLAHFAHHEEIEKKEAEKEAEYRGISVEEVIRQQEEAHLEKPETSSGDSQATFEAPAGESDPHLDVPGSAASKPNPRPVRVTPPEKLPPAEKYQKASREKDHQAEWGAGSSGFKAPSNPSEKLRKNLPYKYKFRRNWGDF